MTTNDSEIDESGQAESSPQREKWFVVALVFQFASMFFAFPVNLFLYPPWVLRNENHPVDIVIHWIIVVVGTPLCCYGGFRTTLAGFSYMGCAWAGDAPPPRLDRNKQWHAIGVGIIFLSQPFFFWPPNEPYPIFVTCFMTLMGLLLILWALGERCRTRSELHISSDDDHEIRHD